MSHATDPPDVLVEPAYTPPAATLPPTWAERARRLWAAIRLTPGRAAAGTAAAALVVIATVSLVPVTVHARDAAGPITMRCGIDYFVAGHKSAVVQDVCRDAYSGRALVFTMSMTALVLVAVGLGMLLRRPVPTSSPSSALVTTPSRAALVTAAAFFLTVTIGAIVPVRVHGADRQGAFSAQCGVSYYVSGHPRPAVERACRRAYAGHAVVLFIGTIGFAITASVLAAEVFADRRTRVREHAVSVS